MTSGAVKIHNEIVHNEVGFPMSTKLARNRILELLLIVSFGAVLASCTGGKPDENKQRSQQQSEELRDRIMTTQIDR